MLLLLSSEHQSCSTSAPQLFDDNRNEHTRHDGLHQLVGRSGRHAVVEILPALLQVPGKTSDWELESGLG